MLRVYHYPKCGTCKKALQWLLANDVPHRPIDIVQSPPSKSTLEAVYRQSGLPIGKLFNTSGQSYRNGNFKQKLPDMTDRQAIEALARDGKLIKRPLVVGDRVVLIGFDEARYAELLT